MIREINTTELFTAIKTARQTANETQRDQIIKINDYTKNIIDEKIKGDQIK